MCYRPISIRNRKIDYDLWSDRVYLQVPCGKCCQCVKAKRSEWYMRLYYQYLDTQRNGGITLFFTLTFAPAFLPVSHGVPCFSRRKVQLFLKRLRRSLNVDGIKYIVVSEYGGKTHRPHHHGLLFVPKPLNPLYLKAEVTKAWSYGYCDYGRYGGVLSDSRAIGYVAKYIGKDMDFDYNNDDVPKCMHPFHLQSHGLGLYMVDYLGLRDYDCVDVYNKWVKGFTFIPSEDNSDYKQVFIPMYIKRKFMYDVVKVDGKVRFVLNDFGRSVKFDSLNNSIEADIQRFTDLFNNIQNILSDDSRLEVYNKYTHQNFAASTDVRRFLSRYSIEQVVQYASLYHDRYAIPVGLSCDLEAPSLHPFSRRAIQSQAEYICSSSPYVFPNALKSKRLVSRLELNLYNRLMPSYDVVLTMYNGLAFVLGVLAQATFDEQQEQASNLKYFKNSFNY